MKRKLMLILLATVMALALAIPAIADSTIYTEGTLHYKVGDGTITIVGCFGKNEKVTVPAMIAGIPVNTIASGAFAENTYVKIVYLPDTISVRSFSKVTTLSPKTRSRWTSIRTDWIPKLPKSW